MGSEDYNIKSRWKSDPAKRVVFVGLVSAIFVWTFFSLDSNAASRSGSGASTSISKCQWKPEPLRGSCDGIKSTEESRVHLTVVACEMACCAVETCVTFQFRAKEGCLWGGDTRLGGEKDGPSAWCEPRTPAMWHGQWIKTKGTDTAVLGACLNEGWKPKELDGQCFGLGSRRTIPGNTPEACRDACCINRDCRIWQWRLDAGCFFSNDAFNCQEANPQDFEPFFGKRKILHERSYTPHAYSGDFADMAQNQSKGRR